MDPKVKKLAKLFKISFVQAQGLVDAGLDRPSKLMRVNKADLMKVPGIGEATAAKLKRE